MIYSDGEQQWVTAKAALQKLAVAYGSRVAAKAELADLLRDGLITARASSSWQSNEELLSKAWRLPNPVIAELPNIEASTWRQSKWWLEDQSQWRWTNGDFFVTRQKAPFRRTMLKRVQFLLSDIEELASSGPELPAKGPGGAPKRRDAWDLMWMELVGIARAGRLTKSQLRTQKELREELLPFVDIGDGGLGDEAIKPVIRQVWHRFIEKPRPWAKRSS